MDWQTLITAIFVSIAALSIARRCLRILSNKPGNNCGSCGGCSAKSHNLSVTPLVQLGSSPGTSKELGKNTVVNR